MVRRAGVYLSCLRGALTEPADTDGLSERVIAGFDTIAVGLAELIGRRAGDDPR